MVTNTLQHKSQPNTMKTLAMGYILIILFGSALLMLPIASKSSEITPFVTALFTATSATCVTGLVVVDTYSYWSLFGQLVILCLIQMGGIGFMTFAIGALTFTDKRIGLRQRGLIQDSLNVPQLGGIVRMTRFILLGSIIIEAAGAALLSIRFIPQMGAAQGIYFAIFHAVSAFCNAGFDLMGYFSPFISFCGYAEDVLVNVVLMVLIVIGGIGFLVWADVFHHGYHLKKMTLHSKIVILTTAVLIVGGIVLFLVFEIGGDVSEGKSVGDNLLWAAFQSIVPRTAGFNSINLTALSSSSILLIIILMVIGGSSGSTAGGIKTSTFAVLLLCMRSEIKQRKHIYCMGRRIDDAVLRRVCCIVIVYLLAIFSATLSICSIESLPLTEVMFEAASAIGTVGLSLGITAQLCSASQIILILLMYVGRVGCLAILLAVTHNTLVSSKMPVENIKVG